MWIGVCTGHLQLLTLTCAHFMSQFVPSDLASGLPVCFDGAKFSIYKIYMPMHDD